MAINYTYRVMSVDLLARCMEILYEAEGYQAQHIGTRLPFEGESLEDIVRMYAPIRFWLDQERAVNLPFVGASGFVKASEEEKPDKQPSSTVVGAQTL